MKKIEAIIRSEKLQNVVDKLKSIGVQGMTILEAVGWSKERVVELHFRGSRIDIDLLPKAKFEIVVTDDQAERVVRAILEAAKTEEPGDGIIFIESIDEAINIHFGQKVQ